MAAATPPPPPVSPDLGWWVRHHDKTEHGPYPVQSMHEARRRGWFAEDSEVKHATVTDDRWVPAQHHFPTKHSKNDNTNAQTRDRFRVLFRMAETAQKWLDDRGLGKYAPDHPGKWIVLATTAIWILGIPFAYMYGHTAMYSWFREVGSTYVDEASGAIFTSSELSNMAMNNARQWVWTWSKTCVIGWGLGLLLWFAIPASSQPNSATDSTRSSTS